MQDNVERERRVGCRKVVITRRMVLNDGRKLAHKQKTDAIAERVVLIVDRTGVNSGRIEGERRREMADFRNELVNFHRKEANTARLPRAAGREVVNSPRFRANADRKLLIGRRILVILG